MSQSAESADSPSATTSGAPLELRKSRSLWLMPLIRGLVFVVLGLLLTVQPLHTFSRVTALFALFLIVDAVIAALQGWLKRTQTGWRWWLGQGAVDVLFAILILVWPGSSTLALFYLLVVWTLVLGVVSIIGSVALARNRDLGWSWLLTIGLVSTLFGFLLVTRAQKTEGALDVIVMVFGIYALVIGAIHIVSGFSVRWVAQEIDRAITGKSPVIDAMVERKVAATAAAEARSQAKSEAKAQAKAEGAQAKTAEKEQQRAPAPTEPVAPTGAPGPLVTPAVPDGGATPAVVPGEPLPAHRSGRIPVSPDERERRIVDELAAQSFPDTPGVVQQPIPLPMDENEGEPDAKP